MNKDFLLVIEGIKSLEEFQTDQTRLDIIGEVKEVTYNNSLLLSINKNEVQIFEKEEVIIPILRKFLKEEKEFSLKKIQGKDKPCEVLFMLNTLKERQESLKELLK